LEDLKKLAGSLVFERSCSGSPALSPKSDLLRYLSSADICLDPNPSSPLNDFSTWIKVMEYMAMAKPVGKLRSEGNTLQCTRSGRAYVPANDTRAFAQAIANLMDDPVKRTEEMGRYRVADGLRWSWPGSYSAANLVAGYQKLIKGSLETSSLDVQQYNPDPTTPDVRRETVASRPTSGGFPL
jgi:glycosyltransferase involved in cell wall biosynthesis